MKYTPPVTPEEKRFTARVADLIRISQRNGKAEFSAFLNLREKELALQTAGKMSAEPVFFGGYDGAERTMLGIGFPAEEDFPITALDFSVSGPVTHRDVLGSILGLGLEREPVGDILLNENRFRVYVSSAIADYIRSELKRVGKYTVTPGEDETASFLPPQREEHSDTLASLRLDSIVAAVANLSRGEAAELITRGLVSVNHRVVEKVTYAPEEGDVLSVRGYGKFRLEDLSGLSRKGRIIMKYSQFT